MLDAFADNYIKTHFFTPQISREEADRDSFAIFNDPYLRPLHEEIQRQYMEIGIRAGLSGEAISEMYHVADMLLIGYIMDRYGGDKDSFIEEFRLNDPKSGKVGIARKIFHHFSDSYERLEDIFGSANRGYTELVHPEGVRVIRPRMKDTFETLAMIEIGRQLIDEEGLGYAIAPQKKDNKK